MRITFLGAAHEVTGSCYYLEAAGKRFLVDCGLKQGPNYFETAELPVAPSDLDFVLLTMRILTIRGNCRCCMPRASGGAFIPHMPRQICAISCSVTARIFRCQRRSGKPEGKKSRTGGDSASL